MIPEGTPTLQPLSPSPSSRGRTVGPGEIPGEDILGDPDRVRDAAVVQLAAAAQAVHGRHRDAETLGDLPDRQKGSQPAATAIAIPVAAVCPR